MAVDPRGNVYIVNDSTVVKVAAGSNTQTVLPFTGLKEPWAVALDPGGNVYVSDQDNKRVLELAGG